MEKIISEKKIKGIPLEDFIREKEIISRSKTIYDDELVDKIYQEIFAWAKNIDLH